MPYHTHLESTYTDLALYGGKNLHAKTDDGFSPLSEVCNGTVCLTALCKQKLILELISAAKGTGLTMTVLFSDLEEYTLLYFSY